ncbi:hypothetical protein GN956_G6594 [Arapaima gigas]
MFCVESLAVSLSARSRVSASLLRLSRHEPPNGYYRWDSGARASSRPQFRPSRGRRATQRARDGEPCDPRAATRQV